MPYSLSKKFKKLNSNYYPVMVESLNNYHFTEARGYSSDYLDSDHGKKSLEDLLYNRFKEARERIIPWLDSARKLSNLNIIEVGCGSGTGTSPFAEQVNSVIALDIDPEILKVCKDRCELLNIQNVDYHCMELGEYVQSVNANIDAVIFYATLEQMPIDQRVSALKSAWEILPIGGLIIIIDTPNCLFFYDGHTSGLPFHHWITDELAYRYVEVMPSSIFRSEQFDGEITKSKMDEFIGWGRSISYHDLEISFKKLNSSFKILKSLSSYENEIYFYENKLTSIYRKIRFKNESVTDRYMNLMIEYQPEINPSFFHPYLNIIIEKS